MKSLAVALVVSIVVALGAATASAQSRSVGQVIDDTTITAEVKAKLVADTLSSLTKIGVSTRSGVVTLSGEAKSPDVKARAVEIASTVKGVRTVVDDIQVVGGPVAGGPATAPPDGSIVDVTGVVSQADPATGTIILQDGRVLRTTSETMVWQPTTLTALRPGTPVLVRGAAPIGVQSAAPSGDWRMGTVRSVEGANGRIVLADGTLVRLAPGVVVRRGAERLAVEQIPPGSEIVFRPTAPSPGGSAEGYASPRPSATVDAAEINVVWMPTGAAR